MCQRLQQGTVDEDEDCGPDSETGSWKSFAAMSEEQKVAATSCTVAWGKGEGERLDWEFQSRTERVDLGHLPAEADLPCPIDADNVNLDGDLSANFFKRFLPDVKGHGKRADKCLSDKRAGFHGTHESRADFKVESDGPDPDAKIKRASSSSPGLPKAHLAPSTCGRKAPAAEGRRTQTSAAT